MADVLAGLFGGGSAAPQMTPDPTTIGMPASFAYDTALVHAGLIERPTYTGSNLGVPAVDQIAGETPGSGSNAAAEFGQAAASRAPHNQPVFWSVVMMAAGVFLLAHAARMNIRG